MKGIDYRIQKAQDPAVFMGRATKRIDPLEGDRRFSRYLYI
jgi:hypothetical protein